MYVYIYIYYICNYIIITITTITILDVYLCRFDTYDYTYQVCIHGLYLMFLPRVFLHHGHKHGTTGSLGLLRRCLRRGCCRFCVKGFHFEGLKMLGNISKFKISSNLKHQPGPNPKLLSDMTCHWPFWPNSELSKLHFTHEGMPNTS